MEKTEDSRLGCQIVVSLDTERSRNCPSTDHNVFSPSIRRSTNRSATGVQKAGGSAYPATEVLCAMACKSRSGDAPALLTPGTGLLRCR